MTVPYACHDFRFIGLEKIWHLLGEVCSQTPQTWLHGRRHYKGISSLRPMREHCPLFIVSLVRYQTVLAVQRGDWHFFGLCPPGSNVQIYWWKGRIWHWYDTRTKIIKIKKPYLAFSEFKPQRKFLSTKNPIWFYRFPCPRVSCYRYIPSNLDWANKKHHVFGLRFIPSAQADLIKSHKYDLKGCESLRWPSAKLVKNEHQFKLRVRAKTRHDSLVHADKYKTPNAEWLMG